MTLLSINPILLPRDRFRHILTGDLIQGGFHMNSKHNSKVPVFEQGLAQPVFPFTDGKTIVKTIVVPKKLVNIVVK